MSHLHLAGRVASSLGRSTRESKEAEQVDPSQIMQVGMGFWASKTLLSAVELELFTPVRRDWLEDGQS